MKVCQVDPNNVVVIVIITFVLFYQIIHGHTTHFQSKLAEYYL